MRINDDCFTLHTPVLLKQIISIMDPGKSDVVIDCTCGLGGHAEEFLKKIGPKGTYICIDRDKLAQSECKKKLEKLFPKHDIRYINDNFSNIKSILEKLNLSHVDHLIADLGISSFQLDNPERGFSHKLNGPLDMRMNQNDEIDAKSLLSEIDPFDLRKILMKYGEIPQPIAKKIANNIVYALKDSDIQTTQQLKDIINKSIVGKPKKSIETLVFQAIRIEVNQELASIEKLLTDAFNHLNTGCKLGMISFHSLEDRIVKKFFKHWSKKCLCEKEILICTCEQKFPKRLKIVNKKIIIPDEKEIEENSRSRSAKLRIAQIV